MRHPQLSPVASFFGALALPVALAFGLVACDDSAAKQKEADEQAAKAKAEEEERAAAEERKKKREAQDQAEAEAEAQRKAQIDALAVLPEKFPKKLDKVCADVGKAQNDFMDRVYADQPETLEKWKANPSAQQMIIAQCKKTGSVESAACQVNALNNAPQEFSKSFPELLSACNEKFGPAAAAAPPA